MCGLFYSKKSLQTLAELKTFGNLYNVITDTPSKFPKNTSYIFISNPLF